MEETKRVSLPLRFGIFEVDLNSGELRRQGYKVKLQEQPFQVLIMLLEHPGDVVTREELQKQLWPADTFVDFERGLNRAINKLREALGDDADAPHFIETLPRRGYRFLAPLETAAPREPDTAGRNRLVLIQPDLSHVPRTTENESAAAPAPRRQVLPWAAAAVLAVVALFGYWKPWRSLQIVPDRPFLQLDLDIGPDEFVQPAISPDGTRIVFVSKGALAVRRLD
jgi:DNA-binding winged helix-turn-helix (wHTH) protein